MAAPVMARTSAKVPTASAVAALNHVAFKVGAVQTRGGGGSAGRWLGRR